MMNRDSREGICKRTGWKTSVYTSLLLALVAGGLAACQSPNVLYVSDTTVGVLDVGGNVTAPTQATVGLKSYELAVVPEKPDGTAHSVIGFLDADLNANPFKGTIVHQGVVTGEAAACAVSKRVEKRSDLCTSMDALIPSGSEKESVVQMFNKHVDKRGLGRDKAFFAGTNTRIGVRIGYGEGEAVGVGALSYKRRVFASIPITKNEQYKVREVRPLYADTFLNSLTKCKPGDDGMVKKMERSDATEMAKKLCSHTGGARIVQTLATGTAAKIIALGQGGTSMVDTVLGESAE